ncbi:hypothetical protein Tco_1240177 [Tanacetum coccineum]
MVESRPMEEGTRGTKARYIGIETHRRPTKPVSQTKKTHSPSPAFIKGNIDVLRTMIKEHDKQAKTKGTPRRLAYADSDKEASAGSLARSFSDRFSLESFGMSDTHSQTHSTGKSQRNPSKNKEPSHRRRSRRLKDQSRTKEKVGRSKSRGKRSGHQEKSSDSEYEKCSKDTYEDLNSPYKIPEPAPFTQRITRFKYHRRAKLPRNIRVYEGNKDLEDHLSIFLAAAEKNFHNKRDMPKTLQRFTASREGQKKEKGNVRSAWSGESEKARNRGGPRETRRNMGIYTPYAREDPFTLLTKTLKEILAMESVSFPKPPPLIGTPEKQNLNEFCDYHRDRGHNTNDYEFTFLAIPQNQLMNEPIILEGMIEDHQAKKMQISANRFLGRNVPPFGDYRPSSNYKRGRKEQNGADGVCDRKCHSPYNVIIGRTGTRSLGAEGKGLASLMEYPYKCFLRLPKENSQIRMAENDEENTRMMEKVLADQKGQNSKVYLEEILVKSKNEQSLVQDVEETLRKLKRVNIKIDPSTSSFKVEEGRFLGHVVTKEGVRANPEKVQTIIRSPILKGPNQIRSLFLQLKTIGKFIPKLVELKYPISRVCMRLDAAIGPGWTNEDKEALQKIKRKLNKLQTLAILKEGEVLMLCM